MVLLLAVVIRHEVETDGLGLRYLQGFERCLVVDIGDQVLELIVLTVLSRHERQALARLRSLFPVVVRIRVGFQDHDVVLL